MYDARRQRQAAAASRTRTKGPVDAARREQGPRVSRREQAGGRLDRHMVDGIALADDHGSAPLCLDLVFRIERLGLKLE